MLFKTLKTQWIFELLLKIFKKKLRQVIFFWILDFFIWFSVQKKSCKDNFYPTRLLPFHLKPQTPKTQQARALGDMKKKEIPLSNISYKHHQLIQPHQHHQH